MGVSRERRADGSLTGNWIAEIPYVEQGTGKRKRKRKTVKTEAEGRRWVKQQQRDKLHGTFAAAGAEAKRAPLTVRDIAARSLKVRSVDKASRYMQDQRTYTTRFLDWLERQGVDVRDVTSATLDDWKLYVSTEMEPTRKTKRAQEGKRGNKSSSVNSHMTAAIQLLKALKRRGEIAEVPTGSRMNKRDQERRRALSPGEAKALVADMREHGDDIAADFVVASIFTGLRKMALLGATPEHLVANPDHEIGGGYLRLGAQKNGEVMSQMVDAEVFAMLEKRLPWDLTVNRLEGAFERATTRLGWRGDKNLHFVLHGNRHTGATWALGGGADIRGVQAFMGHSSIEVTQGYTHMVPEVRAAVVQAIRGYSRGLLSPTGGSTSPVATPGTDPNSTHAEG